MNKSLKKSQSISGILGWILTFIELAPKVSTLSFKYAVAIALVLIVINLFRVSTKCLDQKNVGGGGEGRRTLSTKTVKIKRQRSD